MCEDQDRLSVRTIDTENHLEGWGKDSPFVQAHIEQKKGRELLSTFMSV